MKKKFMIPTGIFILLLSFAVFVSGVRWPWGWGVGLFLIIFGLFGDTSTPETNPKSIKQTYKNNLSGDYEKAIEIISVLNELSAPWVSKNCPTKLQKKLITMKSMATASITYKYGESLITSLKLSFTKSKDTYMITIVGEGKERLEFIQRKLVSI